MVFRCLSRLLQGLKEHPDNAVAEEVRAVAIAALGTCNKADGWQS